MLVISAESDTTFPKEALVWNDEAFWKKLTEAEMVIRPLCDASFLMQKDSNTMAHVVVMLLNIYKGLTEYSVHHLDAIEATRMTADINKRWKETEQPLFFLAFALHPQFAAYARSVVEISEKQRGTFVGERNTLTAARLAEAACFYYENTSYTSPKQNRRKLNRCISGYIFGLKGK